MTWVGVSGSWRYAAPGLQDAVHREVTAALAAGKSIVTGGALGVDYWATETALSIDPARLKVILPTSLATYAAHYRRLAARGVISAQQAEDLIRQLEAVIQAGSLVEHPERRQVVDVTTYYLRNQDMVDVADELLAFQVNASGGTQDALDRARLKGIPVVVFKYQTPGSKIEKRPNDETLRNQYTQVCASFHGIDEFRGKLLALWPILGGAAGGVSLLATNDGIFSPYLWAIGLFGLLVSIGLAVYEWTQTLACQELKAIARQLERDMGFDAGNGQFLTNPGAFNITFKAKKVAEQPQPEREAESGSTDKSIRSYPIRVGVASVIVYTSVILGWVGIFILGLQQINA